MKSAPWLMVVVGVALHVGSLDNGLRLDDHIYTRLIEAHLASAEVRGQWYEVAGFRNRQGAAGIARGIAAGELPWWTDPQGAWAMFRPAAVVTHYVDMLLWPGSPSLMHAHNLLWQGGFLAALWLLYQRLCATRGVALIALCLAATAARNGEVVGWLATRNAIMMATFGALALYSHDRWRRDGWRHGRILAPLCLLLSLWSSEGGVGLWAALLAHALWFERGDLRSRARALAPMAVVTLGWQLHYRVLGFGARGGTLYLDPVADAAAFWSAVPDRVGPMLVWLLGLPMPTAATRWSVAVGLGVFTAAVLLWLARRDRALRMWLFAGAVALLPLCAGPPSDRMLLWPGVCFVAAIAHAAARLWTLDGWLRAAVRPAVVLGLGLHVGLGVWLIPSSGGAAARAQASLQTLADSLPPHARGGRSRIVLNTPETIPTLFALFLSSEAPFAPGAQYLLGASPAVVTVTRTQPHAIRLHAEGGYLLEPGSQVYRGPNRPLRAGRHFALGGAHLTVERVTPDGRPETILYAHPDAGRLEDAAAHWVTIVRDGASLRSVDVVLPPVGKSIELPLFAP